MGDFRRFLEDAEDVLKIVQQSPQFQAADKEGKLDPEFWKRYQDRWVGNQTYVERKLPVWYLAELIQNGRLKMSQTNPQEVEKKKQLGQFNRVVISMTQKSTDHHPMAVLDGTHSLEAAYFNNIPEVDAIISTDALKHLGLGETEQPIQWKSGFPK